MRACEVPPEAKTTACEELPDAAALLERKATAAWPAPCCSCACEATAAALTACEAPPETATRRGV